MRSKSIFFLRRISFTLLLLLFIYLFFLNRRISITNFIQEFQIKRNVEEIPKDWISVSVLREKKKREGKKGKDDFLPLRRNGLSCDCVEQQGWKRRSRNEMKIHRDRVSRFLTFSIRFDRIVEFTLTYFSKVSLLPRPKGEQRVLNMDP